MRKTLVLLLLAFSVSVQAQDTAKVVKSKPMQIKAIKASDFSSAESKVVIKGDFDEHFAHPNCQELIGDEREGCNDKALIDEIKRTCGASMKDARKPVDADEAVEISFSINQFGNVKSINVVYTGDARITQAIIQALYSVPRLIPAKKEGKSVPCSVKMSIPYSVLFPEE